MNMSLRARRFLALGLLASGLLLVVAHPYVSLAASNQRMLMNVQTGKCLTIAGGRSTENNVTAVQFNCDSDPSRSWSINDVGGVSQIKNVQTGKCLTIAGGRSTENNVTAVQFNCDSDPSRTWNVKQGTIAPPPILVGPQPHPVTPPAGVEVRFDRPTYKHGPERLDWCDSYATRCGKPAADDYCRIMGYERASQYESEHASPTRVIVFGQTCTGPTCAAFKFIVCVARQRGPGHEWPHPQD
jgi:hypothetical protein